MRIGVITTVIITPEFEAAAKITPERRAKLDAEAACPRAALTSEQWLALRKRLDGYRANRLRAEAEAGF